MLDFTRLEESYKKLSYFQPDFTEQVEKEMFLRRLQRFISQPIVPGREADYLITQTMAEYLSHVHDQPFQGVLFKSVQRTDGINIVLFADGADAFPVDYVHETLQAFSTTSTEYTHEKRTVLNIDGHVGILVERDDE